MAPKARPPLPGPVVQPNFLPVMEALGALQFPITKRELLDQVGSDTVVFEGRNVELHDLIKDVYDDRFDSEDELLEALERQYMPAGEGEPTEAGQLPPGPEGSDMLHDEELREAIEHAREHPEPERLREDTPDEPGRPEAVNLERADPISTGLRRSAARSRTEKPPPTGATAGHTMADRPMDKARSTSNADRERERERMREREGSRSFGQQPQGQGQGAQRRPEPSSGSGRPVLPRRDIEEEEE